MALHPYLPLKRLKPVLRIQSSEWHKVTFAVLDLRLAMRLVRRHVLIVRVRRLAVQTIAVSVNDRLALSVDINNSAIRGVRHEVGKDSLMGC
jgi:hypothetical protein